MIESWIRVWGWIHDGDNPFFGLIARDSAGRALGLMHCRQMPSPLRGALVGFLDDLFVQPEARGQGVVEALYEAFEPAWQGAGLAFHSLDYRPRTTTVVVPFTTNSRKKTHWITYQKAVD